MSLRLDAAAADAAADTVANNVCKRIFYSSGTVFFLGLGLIKNRYKIYRVIQFKIINQVIKKPPLRVIILKTECGLRAEVGNFEFIRHYCQCGNFLIRS